MKIKFYMNELIKSLSTNVCSKFWFELNFENYGKEEVIISDNIIYDLRHLHGGNEQTNFGTKLIQLIIKADRENFSKLSEIYPEQCYVVWCYQNISEFVEKYLK